MIPKDNTSDTAAAIHAGTEIVEAARRIVRVEAENGVHYVGVGNQGVPILLCDLAEADAARAAYPRRRRGRRVFDELASFIAAVNRWKIAGQSIVWARATDKGGHLECVFNDAAPTGEWPDPQAARPGAWCDDLAIYTTPISTELALWMKHAGASLSQDAFGDLLESRLADLAFVRDSGLPAPTDVLTMARDLQIRTKGEFVRQVDRTTGAGVLVVRDERESTSTPIYRGFMLRIPIFRGGQAREIEARIRFQLADGKRPTFSYELHRIDDLIREEFLCVRDTVAQACEGVPVFAGNP